MRHVMFCEYELEIGLPFASWAGLNRARAVTIRQVAFLSVDEALPEALHPVTRPLGPIVRFTVTVPCSLLSSALGG